MSPVGATGMAAVAAARLAVKIWPEASASAVVPRSGAKVEAVSEIAVTLGALSISEAVAAGTPRATAKMVAPAITSVDMRLSFKAIPSLCHVISGVTR